MKNRSSRIWKVGSNEFKEIVMNSSSYSQIAKHFNYSVNSAVFDMIKERMKHEKIDFLLLDLARNKAKMEQLNNLKEKNEIPLNEILVENSSYTFNLGLKKKLIKNGLMIEQCSKCGIGANWNGEHLSLQLDHINGINNDNRLENLRLLCPNCHSQTPTFCGKHRKVINKCPECGVKINKKSTSCLKCASKKRIGANNPSCKVKNRPSRMELIQLILEKPFVQIGNEYGVSDNAIRKWCKSENLPHRKKDIDANRNQLEAELQNQLTHSI